MSRPRSMTSFEVVEKVSRRRRRRAVRAIPSRSVSVVPVTPNRSSIGSTNTITPVRRAMIPRAASSRRRPYGSMHTAQSYLRGLEDPFFGPVGKLGFGTFVPTGLHSAWKVWSPTIPASTCGVIAFYPGIYADGLQLYVSGNSDNPIGTTPTTTSVTGASTIAQQIQTARIVTAGLRVTLRYATTGIAPSVGGVFIPDDTLANLQGASPNTIRNLSGFREFHVSGGGEKGGQVAFRPIDATSFEFSATYAASGLVPNGPSLPVLAVAYTGIPTGTLYAVDVTVYEVLETLGGLDAAGDDDTSPPNLSIDQIGRIMPTVAPPVTPSLGTLDILDHAMSNIRQSISRTGIGGGVPRLGLNSAASAAASATATPVLRRELSEYQFLSRTR